MDRSTVKAIVERELERYQERFGIPHWRIEVSYDLRVADDTSRKIGQCTRMIDYNRARIELDPDLFDDEEHVLKILRHELYHVVLSPLDLFMQHADIVAGPDNATMKAMLDRTWSYVIEKTAINLERLYYGLTTANAPTPSPATTPPDAPAAIC